MIIVNLYGGLGNQMFQYACAFSLANKFETGLHIKKVTNLDEVNKNKLSDCFNMPFNYISLNVNYSFVNSIKKTLGIKTLSYYFEKNFFFNSDVSKLKPPVYLEGYFQSEKYFISQNEAIRSLYNFESVSNACFWSNEIKTDENSVAIHIRRGDYLNSTNIGKHGLCNIDYYIAAIQKISNKIPNCVFYIFSDDIECAKQEFNAVVKNLRYVVHDSVKPDYYDMYLMSMCKHNIIANSTYSWWSAWLNNNPDKIVIAPSKWFADSVLQLQSADIIPEAWIKI
jgi:hypothetical protein